MAAVANPSTIPTLSPFNHEELERLVFETKRALVDMKCLDSTCLMGFGSSLPTSRQLSFSEDDETSTSRRASIVLLSAMEKLEKFDDSQISEKTKRDNETKNEVVDSPVQELPAPPKAYIESITPPYSYSKKDQPTKRQICGNTPSILSQVNRVFDITKFEKQVVLLMERHEVEGVRTLQDKLGIRLSLMDRLVDVHSLELALIDVENFGLLSVLLNVCQSEDYESLANAIMVIFEANDRSFYMFPYILKKEIKIRNDDPQTLFREDSFCLKIITSYVRFIGKYAIQRFLEPIVQEVERTVQTKEYQSPNRTINYPQQFAHILLNRLIETQDQFPTGLRVLCAFIKKELLRVNPNSAIVGLANIVFLRWLVPSIFQPELYSDRSPPSVEGRKLLVQIAKLVQSCTNAIYCPDPSALDPWVAKHCTVILQFLVFLPKRIDQLDLHYIQNWDELRSYQEVRVKAEFALRKLQQYIELHSGELEMVWEELSTTSEEESSSISDTSVRKHVARLPVFLRSESIWGRKFVDDSLNELEEYDQMEVEVEEKNHESSTDKVQEDSTVPRKSSTPKVRRKKKQGRARAQSTPAVPSKDNVERKCETSESLDS